MRHPRMCFATMLVGHTALRVCVLVVLLRTHVAERSATDDVRIGLPSSFGFLLCA
jgi:hypothetical protein